MYKLIIASHGSMAEGIKSAAKMILNKCDNIYAFGLDTYENPGEILRLTQQMLNDEPHTTFFILCDIKGGSVWNSLLQLLPYPNAKLFSGVNLSMVMTLATIKPDFGVDKAISEALYYAREDVLNYDPSEIADMKPHDKEDELW